MKLGEGWESQASWKQWQRINVDGKPRDTKRNVGQTQIRWKDDIQIYTGRNWIQTAQGRLYRSGENWKRPTFRTGRGWA